jgi:hypothetical protein
VPLTFGGLNRAQTPLPISRAATYYEFVQISRSTSGLIIVLTAYCVTLWQYLGFALYQKIGLMSVIVVFLLATVVVAIVARVILKPGGITNAWGNLVVAVCIVVATVLYFGAFEYSACYFPNTASAAQCTLHVPW